MARSRWLSRPCEHGSCENFQRFALGLMQIFADENLLESRNFSPPWTIIISTTALAINMYWTEVILNNSRTLTMIDKEVFKLLFFSFFPLIRAPTNAEKNQLFSFLLSELLRRELQHEWDVRKEKCFHLQLRNVSLSRCCLWPLYRTLNFYGFHSRVVFESYQP